MAWNCKHSENKMKKLAQTALAGYTINEGCFFRGGLGATMGIQNERRSDGGTSKNAKNGLRL
jgi:hypothetical protein